MEINKKAPAFKAKDSNGNLHSLKDYTGKKLALYFYPKDSTPTCTVQSCSLRDGFAELKKQGIEILGVSADDEKSHKKFIENHKLPFPLLIDTDKKIIESYGVWAEKSMFGNKYMGIKRTTFLINEKGILVSIIDKIKAKEHANQIIQTWKKLS